MIDLQDYHNSFVKCTKASLLFEPMVAMVTVPDKAGIAHEVLCSPKQCIIDPPLLQVDIRGVYSASIHRVPRSEVGEYDISFTHETTRGQRSARFDLKDVISLRRSEYDITWWRDLESVLEATSDSIGHPQRYIDVYTRALARLKDNSQVYQDLKRRLQS